MTKYKDEYDDDYGYDEDGASAEGKSLKGYKLMVLLLAVILVAVSGLYFWQSRQLRADFAVERDTLTNRYMALSYNYANLETNNAALNDSIALEKGRVDSIIGVMAKERRMTRAMIRDYENRLKYMQAAAESFAYTIDSLNTVNKRLIGENIGMRREITSERLRADAAEERAADADIKIRQGSVVIARDIRIVPLNSNDREVSRVSRATRLRIDFVLSANNLANPGNRPVWARVTGPEGYVLPNAAAATFDHEGTPLVYTEMREVDYQNSDLPVGIYYAGNFTAGTYQVAIYMDGTQIGSAELLLR
jgi:cell division protein FtsL